MNLIKLFKYLTKIDYLFILLVCGLVVLQVYLDLELPVYMENIINELNKVNPMTGESLTDIMTILANGGFMVLCALGSLGSAIVVGFLVANMSSRLSYNIRRGVYNKIENFSISEINKFSTASLITRTTNDTTQIQMFMSMGLQALIKAPILAVWAIVKILGKGIEWSMATGVAVGVLLFAISIIIGFTIPKFKKIQTLTDDLNKVTRENLTGVRVVRASNAKDFHEKKFDSSSEKLTKNNLFANRFMGLFGPIMTTIMMGLTLAIYWIGAYIVDNPLLLGEMMTFTSYSMQVMMAFMLLIMTFILMPRALVSSKRIVEVLKTQNSIKPGEEVLPDEKQIDTIVFDKVSFKYPDAEEYILKNISFTAAKGQTVAFIGSTGSGKSTLINLLPRLYDVTEGEILIDGVNIKNLTSESLNNQIGYVPQKGVLFSGSIESNINFGDNNADEEMIARALDISQSKEFVSKKEEGIKSAIAQGGTNVSGGQKQRLSIARAIARNPKIMIFDDSFSALDYRTDKTLRAALKKKTKDVTKFIVGQRIGTIKDADLIIVLEHGEMVGIGTHDQLLKKCKVYKEIALSQLSKEEL